MAALSAGSIVRTGAFFAASTIAVPLFLFWSPLISLLAQVGCMIFLPGKSFLKYFLTSGLRNVQHDPSITRLICLPSLAQFLEGCWLAAAVWVLTNSSQQRIRTLESTLSYAVGLSRFGMPSAPGETRSQSHHSRASYCLNPLNVNLWTPTIGRKTSQRKPQKASTLVRRCSFRREGYGSYSTNTQ
jgi:hypothetical protein